MLKLERANGRDGEGWIKAVGEGKEEGGKEKKEEERKE